MKRAFLTIAPIASALSVLVSCASAPPRPPEPAPKACEPQRTLLALATSERLNPSPSGQARPLQVRVYLLKSDAKLRTARFEDVWQDEAVALQGDVLQVDQYTLYPGDTKTVEIARNPQAHALATVGLFREPPASGWFLAYDLGGPDLGGANPGGPDQGGATDTPRAPPLPCPPKLRRISVALDGMQMQDASSTAAPSASEGPAGAPEYSKDPRGAKGE
jgi:type VI secretion system VasD/TssJ family lipoprotein